MTSLPPLPQYEPLNGDKGLLNAAEANLRWCFGRRVPPASTAQHIISPIQLTSSQPSPANYEIISQPCNIVLPMPSSFSLFSLTTFQRYDNNHVLMHGVCRQDGGRDWTGDVEIIVDCLSSSPDLPSELGSYVSAGE